MQVTANVQPVVKDFTLTLTPTEADNLRNILSNNINKDGIAYFFSVDLRNNIDAAKAQASVDAPSDPTRWFAAGNGDEDLRARRKIYAIKECRQATGCGLKEAKDAADVRSSVLGVY